MLNITEEVFLPNEIVIKAGTQGNSMYFLFTGTVCVLTPSGKEVNFHFKNIQLLNTQNIPAVPSARRFLFRRSSSNEKIKTTHRGRGRDRNMQGLQNIPKRFRQDYSHRRNGLQRNRKRSEKPNDSNHSRRRATQIGSQRETA